jgi:phage terminase small subunit
MAVKPSNNQEAFAQAISNGMNQTDSYRANYACSNMSDKTVTEKASRLAANGKVRARIEELKKELSSKLLWTREKSVKVLADIAEDDGSKPGEKVSAVKELNLMHGYNEPIKINDSISDKVTRRVFHVVE